jgi:adenylyltransferase/sulfurtransferase
MQGITDSLGEDEEMKRAVLSLIVACSVWACSPKSETASETPPPTEPAAAAHETAAEVKEVDVADLKRRLDAGEDIFLLDVRNPDELVEHGMIAGAVNIPIDNLEARLSEVPKDKPIVTYCMRGGRASRAAELLRNHGYDQPIESGGITAWKDAGYEVVQPKTE